ncbi:MAG: hypothetical protein QHC79_25890 [Pseudosphingobacterium sp.]|nr:hypothetical protein [Pseudosphingobacterium sp.]
MTWTQFLIYIAIIYLLYYAANILADLLRPSKNKGDTDTNIDELSLSLDEEPELIIPDEEDQLFSSSESTNKETGYVLAEEPVASTGAVSISKLLELAKMDVIEYTKAIAY